MPCVNKVMEPHDKQIKLTEFSCKCLNRSDLNEHNRRVITPVCVITVTAHTSFIFFRVKYQNWPPEAPNLAFTGHVINTLNTIWTHFCFTLTSQRKHASKPAAKCDFFCLLFIDFFSVCVLCMFLQTEDVSAERKFSSQGPDQRLHSQHDIGSTLSDSERERIRFS